MTGAANRARRPPRRPRWARPARDSYPALRQPHGTGGDGCQTDAVPPLTASHAVPVRACGDRGARHRRVRGVTQRTRREPDGLEWESRNAWNERRRKALRCAKMGIHGSHCRLTVKFVLFTCEQWRRCSLTLSASSGYRRNRVIRRKRCGPLVSQPSGLSLSVSVRTRASAACSERLRPPAGAPRS